MYRFRGAAMDSKTKTGLFRISSILLAFVFCLFIGQLFFLAREHLSILGGKEERTLHYWRYYNDSVNLANKSFADQNPFGFTDIIRKEHKSPGTRRIAVLGDSFIWGDGIPYCKVWSHLLEQEILIEYDNIEVLSWGKNGWSTLDEFRFLKEEGVHFDIDLLIIGYVENDPDMGRFDEFHGGSKRSLNYFFPNVAPHLPRVVHQCFSGVRTLIYGSDHTLYNRWMDSIYSENQLLDHEKMLLDLKAFCKQREIELIFVMTPSGFNDKKKNRFTIMEKLMHKVDIEVLNLMPVAEVELGGYKYEEIIASPVNCHPGELLTRFYSEQVFQHLKELGFFNLENHAFNPEPINE